MYTLSIFAFLSIIELGFTRQSVQNALTKLVTRLVVGKLVIDIFPIRHSEVVAAGLDQGNRHTGNDGCPRGFGFVSHKGFARIARARYKAYSQHDGQLRGGTT